MCGLAGIAVVGGGALPPDADARLRRLGHAVAHRGPDGENFLADGPVGLAFRRLALIDPEGGDQPLLSEDESVVVIANGEVYNHRELAAGLAGTRFRTRSDCEVLPHLYARDGLRFLDAVHGMFAIVLWDRRRNRLVFARDRFGIKPLYYARAGDRIVFSSEIKALFQDEQCPRQLDWEAALGDEAIHAAPMLTTETVATWFTGVEIVPAGTIVTIDLATGATEHHQYWRLPTFDGDSDASDAELVATYRELLAASVADCASADAEVGLFLSGGVDSSAVAALAARGGSFHTFSVLNGSTLVNGDAESAHKVAAALGLPNHQLLFDVDRVPTVEEYKRLLWLLETPLCGPEQYYKYELYRFVKQLRPELRGMLLGQASDEFNGGYSVQLSSGTDWPGFEAAITNMARSWALRGRPGMAPWWGHHEQLVVADELLRPTADGMLDDPYTAFVAWKYRSIQQYNCWHEDRTAAGNGIEARVPFLDHRIIELTATIPAERRARLLWDKRILRDAVRDVLPAAIAERPKVSFYHGDGAEYTQRTFVRMLLQDGAALLEESLASPGAQRYLRADAVRGMLARLATEQAPAGVEFLLRLVNLGLLDQMTRDLPTLPVDAPRRELAPASPILDWDRDAPAVGARMRQTRAPRLDDVVALGDDVLVVQAPAEPETLYVSVNGQFEYVIEAAEDRAWWAFLRGVDGRRSVAELLDAGGATLDEVAEVLADSVEMGLLEVTGASPAEGGAGTDGFEVELAGVGAAGTAGAAQPGGPR